MSKVGRAPVAVLTAAPLIGCKHCCEAVHRIATTWLLKAVKVLRRNCGWWSLMLRPQPVGIRHWAMPKACWRNCLKMLTANVPELP